MLGDDQISSYMLYCQLSDHILVVTHCEVKNGTILCELVHSHTAVGQTRIGCHRYRIYVNVMVLR